MTTGLVAYVEPEVQGSQSAADASSGDLVLLVTKISVFIGSRPGGRVSIDGGDPIPYDDASLSDDEPAGSLIFSGAGLPDDVPVGVRVDLWDLHGPVVEYYAGVIEPGADGPVRVTMPPELIELYPIGQRSADEQEQVELEQTGDGTWRVAGPTPGMTPLRDLGYADGTKPMTPGTLALTHQTHADDLAAAIRPDGLSDGDVLANLRVLASILSGGNGTGSVGIGQQGWVNARSSGETASAFLNTDEQADRLRGIIETIYAVMTGTTFIDGMLHIGQGTTVQYHSRTIPPIVYPTGVEDWPAVVGDFSGHLPGQRIGFAAVSATEMWQLVHNGLERRLVGVNPTSGAALGVATLTGGPSDVWHVSVTYSSLNDRLLTLGTDGTDWLVESWAMPSAGACVFDALEFVWTGGEHPGRPDGVLPTLTCTDDAGQERVILAQTHRGDGTVIYAQYLDGVFDDQGTTTTPLDLGDLAGVAVLTGNTRIVLASSETAPGNPYRDADGNVAMPLVTLASGIVTSTALPVGESNPMCAGISCLDGDPLTNRVWYASRSNDRIIQHSDPNVFGKVWFEAANGDSASGGVTEPGPAVGLTKRPGTRIGVVLSALPRGVDSGLLYAATGNTLPPRVSFHAQNEPLTAGPVFCQIFNIGTTGSNPVAPGASTFPPGLEEPSTQVGEDGSTFADVASYSNPLDVPTRLDALEAGGGSGDRFLLNIEVDEMTGDITFEEVMG